MESGPDPDLTAALADLSDGQGQGNAAARVVPLLYDRLHAMARRHMEREGGDHTLQPTALVNEAYLRLVDQRTAGWKNSAHFFAIAAQAMRRILIDHARARATEKRGGGRARVSLTEAAGVAAGEGTDLLALDEALTRLGAHAPDAARIVEMRFFAGMEVEAIAHAMGVTDRTVRRHWLYARAWLARELLAEEGP